MSLFTVFLPLINVFIHHTLSACVANVYTVFLQLLTMFIHQSLTKQSFCYYLISLYTRTEVFLLLFIYTTWTTSERYQTGAVLHLHQDTLRSANIRLEYINQSFSQSINQSINQSIMCATPTWRTCDLLQVTTTTPLSPPLTAPTQTGVLSSLQKPSIF